jgi:hypothetical protein
MKKVIALSAVLVFGALGMACDGGTAPNANNGNTTKPANLSTPTPAATLAPATNGNMNGGSTTTAPNTNGGKMSNGNMNK